MATFHSRRGGCYRKRSIEHLRDPSHVRMLAEDELHHVIEGAGFEVTDSCSWSRPREYDEWAAIIADPARMASLRVVMQHRARRGETAGIGSRERDGGLEFSYRWARVAGKRV